MSSVPHSSNPRLPELEKLRAANAALQVQVQSLSQQLAWFRRQLFGTKSERRVVEDNPHQPLLDGLIDTAEPVSAPATETITYQRRKGKNREEDCVTEQGLRFDESVPVVTIELSVPASMRGDDYEVIAEKVTYRLAQRPGSHVVLRYVRPVVKHKREATLLSVPAPDGLWEGSMADVSVVAGVLVDKFCYHLPLYRQHQRLLMSGITVARPTLTTWVHRSGALLKPIVDAQLRHVLLSKTLAMDETPIKAGRGKHKGKMKTAWYWPLYGEDDEVVFTFSPTRARTHIEKVLGSFAGTLLSDGASVYEQFTRSRPHLVHAQCWNHTRRMFVKAEELEPDAVAEGLELIGELYRIEAHIRKNKLDAEQTLAYRAEHARVGVDAFFAWCDEQCQRIELIPSNPLSKAIQYAQAREGASSGAGSDVDGGVIQYAQAREGACLPMLDGFQCGEIQYAQAREGALRVYLTDPTVAIDTNHLERALRPIPMGRKSWLFCWTEVGAEYVGIIQSLMSTCRLHGINPYTYLVDVLQRIAVHPNSQVEELTPRRWKTLFADNPLRSDLALVT